VHELAYYHPDDADTIRICSNCITDSFLSQKVRAEGEEATCSYCDETGSTITLADLADRIHDVLEKQFYPTPSEPEGLEYTLAKEGHWERSGDPIVDVIAEVAGLDGNISEDIRACLSDSHGNPYDGGEDPYADDAQYAEQGPDDLNFRDTWESFCQHVRWRSRFFSQYVEVSLDEIFGDLTSLKTFRGISVIREISPSDDDRFVFRARVGFSQAELQNILEYPSRELGPAPARLAKAGRMNAAGISVFYGAADMDTCVAEIRAPVGAAVVAGRFEFIRPVRLLDIDALAQVYVKGSHFDPGFSTQRARAAFLGHLAQMISRPVMPSDETLQYLPTQIVAEYLATKAKPPFDGVIFRSSQTNGEGRNIVLFNHASTVQRDDAPPGTNFDLWMGAGPDDDFDPTIMIFEKIPAAVQPKPIELFGVMVSPPDPVSPDRGQDAAWLPNREPTLCLDGKSVQVLQVNGIRYSCQERTVMRFRTKADEEPSNPVVPRDKSAAEDLF
jgi:hypothetical protein